jgi:hypothetical protein
VAGARAKAEFGARTATGGTVWSGSLGVKQQGHEGEDGAPFSAEVKIGGGIPPVPSLLQGVAPD